MSNKNNISRNNLSLKESLRFLNYNQFVKQNKKNKSIADILK